ncbi:hypothetical protein KXD40_009272 [Peronospora effusa]|nr:hypothetical protein KXD40_009272 [Peronospora effusa]
MKDTMMARLQTARKRKMRNASMFALHDSDSEQEEHDDAPFLMHKGAKTTNDEYGILDVTGLSDEEDNSEEGGQMLSANFTSEVTDAPATKKK